MTGAIGLATGGCAAAPILDVLNINPVAANADHFGLARRDTNRDRVR